MLALVGGLAGAPAVHAAAADSGTPVEFNADFLQGASGQKVDVNRFARGNPVLPGEYVVDLAVNDQWAARVKLRLVAEPGNDSAHPCIDRAIIAKIGLSYSAMPEAARTRLAGLAPDGCADLGALVKGATVDFDQSALRLSVGIPQALLQHTARGYVSPEFWDKGVPSATLAYNTNLFRSDNSGTVTTSVYAGLTGGVNLGSWHVRDQSSINGTNGQWQFQNIAAYVQHDLPKLQSSLTIGDTFTDGAVFDSFSFRGVSLATDDRMRPESQQGYAPAIHGIARTNARVRVTQNGNLLLETTVSPGPFEIDDLYPTGYGGDLLVTVYEADGSQQSFTVTYASLVQLLRPNVWRYSLAGGAYRNGTVTTGEHFVQAAVQHGISNTVTGYAGASVADGYASGLAGVAINTDLGALAFDATLAQTTLPGLRNDQGYSLRVSYSKIVPGLRTNLSLAAYEDSSSGYWSLQEAMQAGFAISRGLGIGTIQRQHRRFQLNISQNLGKNWGSIYISGSTTSYWNQGGTVTELQAGYTNVAHLGLLNVNYGLSFTRQLNDVTDQIDNRALLTLSFAAGRKPTAPRVNANLTEDRSGGQNTTTGQVSVSGAFGANSEYTYNANANSGPGENSVGIGAGYRAPFATLSASASTGDGFNQFSAGASGGIVIHPGGVTMANQMGDTIGIVEAHDAKGATIASAVGVKVDGRGYAVLPYLMPYRQNEVSIDPEAIPLDVELKSTSQQVAPRANTVVMVKFETSSGKPVMVSAHLQNGAAVPFGASVYDIHRSEVGIVGQDGKIFLRGIPETGHLQVKWGDDRASRCSFDYKLPSPAKGKDKSAGDILHVAATCQPENGKWVLNERGPWIDALPLQ